MDCKYCGNPGCGGIMCQDGTWGFYDAPPQPDYDESGPEPEDDLVLDDRD